MRQRRCDQCGGARVGTGPCEDCSGGLLVFTPVETGSSPSLPSGATDRIGARVAMAVAAALLLLSVLALLGGGATTGSSSSPVDRSTSATRSDAASALEERPDGADLELTDSSVASTASLATDQWFPDRRHPSTLAIVRFDTISVLDVTSGESAEIELPADATGDTTTVDGHVVYISHSGARALRVSLHGDADEKAGDTGLIELGPADTLRRSGNEGYVWFGMRDLTDGPGAREFTWEERNLAGEVLRSTRRTFPLEFDRPDLIWGFDSSMFRLTESDRTPWRLIADGYPIAAGASDVILMQCDHDDDPDRNCRRAWFDAVSGDQRDLLHGDAADNIGTHFGGRVSPAGRYVTRQVRPGAPVDIWQVGTGAVIENRCADQTDISWSLGDYYFACLTAEGLVAVDTQSGAQLIVGGTSGAGGHGLVGWVFLP